MSDIAELSATETLAAQLFAVFEVESGDILRGAEWMGNMDERALAAWKWMRLSPRLKDAWLAVAEAAQRLAK